MAKANDDQAGAPNPNKSAPTGWYFSQVAMQVIGGLTVAAVCALVGYAWALSSTVAILQERLNTVPKAEEIVSLQERVKSLESEKVSAAALENSINTSANSVSLLSSKVDALCSATSKLETLMNLPETVATLRERIAKLESASQK